MSNHKPGLTTDVCKKGGSRGDREGCAAPPIHLTRGRRQGCRYGHKKKREDLTSRFFGLI